ncbi:hypothetical protein PT287_08655 [Lactobacillus sp. ESL0679]|uniref:hypothetical protein n=1 Tax=Lactobacillus sp. ESL0679 TaxID=2983209 RepID=UPI0023F7A53E|nr:hypothetical protein [Lactobacillus sp. ESL0679]MDF7683566.1 hypothetical protein [Lactobacillus sp. ESL0679]
MKIKISLKDTFDKTITGVSDDDLCVLPFKKRFQDGDYYEVNVEHAPMYLMVQLDAVLNPTLIYLAKPNWRYKIPMNLERYSALPDGAFTGEHHYACVRKAEDYEINAYQNLARNSHDQRQESGAYPHISANAETRGEEPFLVKNVIDGYLANKGHGRFPFQSWGIDARDDAKLKLDFGRPVNIAKIGIQLRADYPHDSYWTKATIKFSNNNKQIVDLVKTAKIQYFVVNQENVSFLSINNLIRDSQGDPDSFPSLSQLIVLGKNK